MNYQNIHDTAQAAQDIGESLVLVGSGSTVAVIPIKKGRLRVFPLHENGEAIEVCESSFQNVSGGPWKIHPNFTTVLAKAGERHGT
ncbi:MAG: hypothetical protein KKA05_12225 [Alphaproteobacteria bacterium]|nr:hypothetical protein [Alphaproteobacteria bacterium]